MEDALSSLPALLSLIGTKRWRLSFLNSGCSVRQQDGAEKEEGRCVRTSGHVTGYFAGGTGKDFKGPTNTMLFSDYHLAKLNPKCHMNYLDYL